MSTQASNAGWTVVMLQGLYFWNFDGAASMLVQSISGIHIASSLTSSLLSPSDGMLLLDLPSAPREMRFHWEK